MIDWIEAGGWMPLVTGALAIIIAVAAALAIHAVAGRVLRRVMAKRQNTVDTFLLSYADRPVKWIMVVVAIGLAQRSVEFAPWLTALWRQAVGFILPALFGWLALNMILAVQKIVESRADISVENNLEARRRRTRVGILARIAAVLVLFLTICMMLVSIPGVRSVGVTLMASAGLAGLAVGAAAQPALKNLIAGIQMAFTEPIRLDDVVIIGGEWGRIEEIRLTYVVVRIWDDRRLVVPVSKFLEEPFQNWTRQSAQLLGSAFFYLDPTADVAKLRTHLETVVKASPLWDKRFFNLQVTDLKADSMEVRVLATAGDASKAFDLRCYIREEMMAFVVKEMPDALPRNRQELTRLPSAPPKGDAALTPPQAGSASAA